MGLNNLQQRGTRDEGETRGEFRDRAVAAPLKLYMTPAPPRSPAQFRDRAVAAPLKQRSRGRSWRIQA